MKPVINIADAPVHFTSAHGEVFEGHLAELSPQLGAKLMAANITRVPPGKAAFPIHHHYANEEHFYIVSGSGLLRFGAEQYPVKTGDYVVCPPGGPEVAHQFVNTGSETLSYLAISTRLVPEVVGYPDAQKTGVAIVPRGEPGPARFLLPDSARTGTEYWDGEDGAAVRAALQSKS